MNVVAILSFFAFVASFCFGMFVYYRNPKAVVNRSFLLLSLSAGLLALVEFGYARSENAEEAAFWRQAHGFWPLVSAFLVHFTLVFSFPRLTRSRLVHGVWAMLLLFVSAAVAVKGALRDSSLLVSGEHRFGWIMGTLRSGPTMAVENLFFYATWGATFIAMLSLFRHRNTVRNRKRRFIIAVAFVLSLVYVLYGRLGHRVAQGLELPAPPMGLVVILILSFYLYTIWRYGRYALAPIAVADSIVSAMDDALMLVNTKRKIESFNEAATKILEYGADEMRKLPLKRIFDKGTMPPQWVGSKSVAAGQPHYLDTRLRTKRGRQVPVSLSTTVLSDNRGETLGYLMIARDIEERNRREQELQIYKNRLERLVERRTRELTSSLNELRRKINERQRAEEKRETLKEQRASLEEQLYHVQKMESIGRLAGGVSHDFNNLLFVINTYSESFLKNMSEHHPLFNDFKEIYRAATRATSLTQQLLAFSRKQIASPKLIDPSRAAAELSKMLKRIVGKNIEFEVIPLDDSGRIAIDPGQFDQILVNLAVNSRDAMPTGGRITVVVKRVTLSSADYTGKGGLAPGDYLMVEFTDNGVGMSNETQEKIFDPFFTTKAPGKGTGLGLSTIYGIVKQNHGSLTVSSALGVGTTFRICFPRHEPMMDDEDKVADFVALRGEETILLVEDEPQVRHLAARLLEQLGYRVITASGAGEAMRAVHENQHAIDLLFTDIVMPGVSGRELSDMLHKAYPHLKVLYMSGYSEEIETCPDSVPLLAKPFSFRELSSKIREILDT